MISNARNVFKLHKLYPSRCILLFTAIRFIYACILAYWRLQAEVVVERGYSSFSGYYEVRDMPSSKGFYRALRSESFMISSLALLQPPSEGDHLTPTRYWKICDNWSPAPYIRGMLAAAMVLTADSVKVDREYRVLSIGIGGGVLQTILHRRLPSANITAVEIDENMMAVARKWFQLPSDSRMHNFLADGIEFLRNSSLNSGEKYDLILLDACKISSWVSTCPTKDFLDLETIQNMAKSLNPTGALIVNLLSPIQKHRLEAKRNISKHFSTLFSKKFGNNEIVIALLSESEENHIRELQAKYQKELTKLSSYSLSII